VLGREQLEVGRLAGLSIAHPLAAVWLTDFLGAAYYARPVERRQLDDLRLAFAVLTTFWVRAGGRRLNALDLPAFSRAFGRPRFLERRRSEIGTLSREQLLEGAARLLGSWFPDAYHDDTRRAFGVVFETVLERERYRPEQRLAVARVGPLTPPVMPGEEQTWHTYPPVEVSSAEAAAAVLARTETWPDFATETGRFTPLRSSELHGQTFEIDVAAGASGAWPVFQRGHVTVDRLVGLHDPGALRAYIAELEDGLARFGRDEPRAVPEGGEPVLGFDLTTHKGHFMGRGRNRLILFRHDGRAWLRAAGTWDPMPWHLHQAYHRAGRDAQQAFWGEGADESRSMLHQIARRVAAAERA
jgi:hypothetical protein